MDENLRNCVKDWDRTILYIIIYNKLNKFQWSHNTSFVTLNQNHALVK